ncbi:MAG: OB-fold nucleic acid binding domain-containing protein [Jatrophihabitans sp.]|uniref:OB-fold nucleic acid binding domain-containing protein n=1 Tax=Jatrophihabitans sp. TaxID=1932789 RepID=UPI003F7E637B
MGRQSLLHRLTASASRLDADELQEHVQTMSCTRLDVVERGGTVRVVGRLRSVRYTPNETVPTLEAELFDGSSTLTLVWLGRRRIPGVEPGRRIVAKGRVGLHDGQHAIFNPWYELLPSA